MSDFLAVTVSRKHHDGSKESMSFNVPLRGVRVGLSGPNGGLVTFVPVRFPDRFSPFPVDTAHRSIIQEGQIRDDDGWGVTEMFLCLREVRMDVDVRRFDWMKHGHYLLYGFGYDLDIMLHTANKSLDDASVLRARTALLMIGRAMRRWLDCYRIRQAVAARQCLDDTPCNLIDKIEGLVLRG